MLIDLDKSLRLKCRFKMSQKPIAELSKSELRASHFYGSSLSLSPIEMGVERAHILVKDLIEGLVGGPRQAYQTKTSQTFQ